jgi:hypothetical protein
MIMDGAVSPSLMEDVLGDLAARCAIRAVVAEDGTDLLLPAVEAALATLKSAAPVAPSRAPGARPSAAPPMPRLEPPPVARVESSRSDSRIAASVRPEARPVFPEGSLVLSEPPPPPTPSRFRSPAPPAASDDDDDTGAPSSLEDAVMREISDRSPVPGVAHPSSPNLPPLIEPSALRPRSSNPPANELPREAEDRTALPSIPPDAIVPGASSVDDYAAAPAASLLPASPSTPPPTEAGEALSEASEPATPDATPIGPPPQMDEGSASPAGVIPALTPSQPPAAASAPAPSSLASQPPPPASPVASQPPPAMSDAPPEPPRAREPWGLVLAFALLGGAVAAVLRVSGGESEAPVRPRPPEAVVSAAPPPPAVSAPVPSPAPAPAADDLPPGADVPTGYGLLDVTLPQGAAIQVDGRVVTSPAAVPPGHHEVHVEVNGRAQEFGVEVRAGHVTHARPPTAP